MSQENKSASMREFIAKLKEQGKATTSLSELLDGIEEEETVEEMTVTGDVAGFETPGAFSGKASRKKKDEDDTRLAHGTLAKQIHTKADNINEGYERVVLDTLKKKGIKAGFEDGVLHVGSVGDKKRAITWLKRNKNVFELPDIQVKKNMFEQEELTEGGSDKVGAMLVPLKKELEKHGKVQMMWASRPGKNRLIFTPKGGKAITIGVGPNNLRANGKELKGNDSSAIAKQVLALKEGTHDCKCGKHNEDGTLKEVTLPGNFDDITTSLLYTLLHKAVTKKIKAKGPSPIVSQMLDSLKSIQKSLKGKMNLKGKEAYNAFAVATKGHFTTGMAPMSSLVRRYKVPNNKFSGDLEVMKEEQEKEFEAFFNKKKIVVKATSLYAAKKEAIKQFKVPKSKEGYLAVQLKGSKNYRFSEEKVNENQKALEKIADKLSDLELKGKTSTPEYKKLDKAYKALEKKLGEGKTQASVKKTGKAGGKASWNKHLKPSGKRDANKRSRKAGKVREGQQIPLAKKEVAELQKVVGKRWYVNQVTPALGTIEISGGSGIGDMEYKLQVARDPDYDGTYVVRLVDVVGGATKYSDGELDWKGVKTQIKHMVKKFARQLTKHRKDEAVNEGVGHIHQKGKDYFVDSNFINLSQKILPNSTLKHAGFGEFYLQTPEGDIQFQRSNTKFDGQVGRSHKIYDDKNGKIVKKLVVGMLKAKKAEKVDEGFDVKTVKPSPPHKGQTTFGKLKVGDTFATHVAAAGPKAMRATWTKTGNTSADWSHKDKKGTQKFGASDKVVPSAFLNEGNINSITPREIVDLAAKRAKNSSVAIWLRMDERGLFEKIAKEGIEKLKAHDKFVGGYAVTEELADYVLYFAIEAMIRDAKKSQGSKPKIREADNKSFKKGDSVTINTKDPKGKKYNGKSGKVVASVSKNSFIVKVGNQEEEFYGGELSEATYREFKREASTPKQKIGRSIKEINGMLFRIERIIKQSSKLKLEVGIDPEQYWHSTHTKIGKVTERIVKVARALQELQKGSLEEGIITEKSDRHGRHDVHTMHGVVHVNVESDPGGIFVDVMLDKSKVATVDIQVPAGNVKVTNKSRIKLK